ncbi:MAG: DEAD/DEAH box helicase [Oscillospiraceae bacterium]|nr:DEAD/DEAH box helicase [Oscillospiraceae bacterium]
MNPTISRASPCDLKILEERLTTHTQQFYPPEGALNKLRCGVLDACRKNGEGPRGLYTLTVPTGGGKTLASLAFALRHGVCHGMNRVIYVVPYTSIIDQTAEVFREVLGRENVLEHHSGVLFDDTEEDQKLALATENWDMPIVVTTAVQFFESLYANRSSKCRKLHNIANAVVVFDEAQMIPLPYLTPCVFAIAELIRHYNITALLCTATQPALDNYFSEYGLTPTEICPNPDALFTALRRTSFFSAGQLDLEALGQELSMHTQVLCVVNLRKAALALMRLLPEEGRYCLTTLQCPADRKRVLKEIRQRLDHDLPCRVVSTSLIEAGVDVDFPKAFRELTGLDSILQTAGRCNREGKNSAQESIVTVFSLPEGVPKLFQQNVDATKRTTKKYDRIDTPEAISEYFKFLRKLKGSDALDQKHILDSFRSGLNGCAFPFAQLAKAFCLIDSPTITVYIPTEENKELIVQLRSKSLSRNLFRKLGQFSVNVYQYQLQNLQQRGAVEILCPESAILNDKSLYDPAFGLQPDAEADIDHYFI